MIQIPRLLLRQFWAALRRSRPPRSGRESLPWVVVEAGNGQVTLRSQHADALVRVQVNGDYNADLICLPARALDDAAGCRGNVVVEPCGDKVVLRWEDKGIPQVKEYETTDPAKLPPFPALPASFVTNPPGLLKALDDAMKTAVGDSARYALTKIQLRRSGEIVGTDGRQLLMQAGFQFPWKDDVLVSRSGLFGGGVLPDDVPVKVGRTANHVFVCVGDWSIGLPTDTQSRYPQVEQVIPKALPTTWTLSPDDATGLIASIGRLPGDKDDDSPVTVHLNGKVAIRAKGVDNGQPVELILGQSKVVGPPVQFVTNRHYLLWALQLGFREVRISSSSTPMLCQDQGRKFVWMPMVNAEVIPSRPDATRIVTSKDNGVQKMPVIPQRKPIAMVPVESCPTKTAIEPAVPSPVQPIVLDSRPRPGAPIKPHPKTTKTPAKGLFGIGRAVRKFMAKGKRLFNFGRCK